MSGPRACRILFVALNLIVFFAAAPAALAQTVVVLPYLQPGDGRNLAGADVKVIRWLTDHKPGEFTVEFQIGAGPLKYAAIERIALDFDELKPAKKEEAKEKKDVDEDDDDPKDKKDPKDKDGKDAKDAKDAKEKKEVVPPLPEKEQHFYRYTAVLTDLPFNSEVGYRVRLAGKTVRAGSFRTRATADRSVRCVLVGDLAQGRKAQNEIAYQISRQRPEFLMALGDIVYPSGRVTQYMGYFWNTYNNTAEAGPKSGAPLMASTTIYPVLGNHDIAAKLSKTPDALGVYYFFAPPRNGPGEGPWTTPLDGDPAVKEKFRAATRDSYPFADAYSFDYGPAHFVVLNDNYTLKIEAPEFLHWLCSDLKSSKARWKFVCYHIPGFQSAKQHYIEQQIRPLQPLFEECGVDIAFAGHVHNYQRSVPLKFAPDPLREHKRKIEGVFTLDTVFDGKVNTVPSGVIHIVAGGGGASLYGPGLEKVAADLKKQHGANFADFTTKMIVDKHSFVTLDIEPTRLHLRAISAAGDELDAITITKVK